MNRKQWVRTMHQVSTFLVLGVWLSGWSGGMPVLAVERLTDEAIAQQADTFPDWRIIDQTLQCTYEFGNFVESIDFVNQLVEPAEALGHHPDLEISYNRVTVVLTTHDAGGLSQLDFALARTVADVSDRPCLHPHPR